jgi:hypothetical protein
MGGWMDGWMEVKAVLRNAYSNQKIIQPMSTKVQGDGWCWLCFIIRKSLFLGAFIHVILQQSKRGRKQFCMTSFLSKVINFQQQPMLLNFQIVKL